MKQLFLVTFSALVFIAFAPAAFACPGCSDCKKDHDKVCADECKIKDLKDSMSCDKDCKKEKCSSECTKCKEAKDASAACAGDKAASGHGIAEGGCVQTPQEKGPKVESPTDMKKG